MESCRDQPDLLVFCWAIERVICAAIVPSNVLIPLAMDSAVNKPSDRHLYEYKPVLVENCKPSSTALLPSKYSAVDSYAAEDRHESEPRRTCSNCMPRQYLTCKQYCFESLPNRLLMDALHSSAVLSTVAAEAYNARCLDRHTAAHINAPRLHLPEVRSDNKALDDDLL